MCALSSFPAPPLNRTVIAVIPSRYGSSRFPGKPLADIAGKPMIQRVYEGVAGSPEISDTIVATDDDRIRDAVLAFGGKAMITSPENRSGTDRVGEVARRMELKDEDILINIQGDQPLIDSRCLAALLAPFASRPPSRQSSGDDAAAGIPPYPRVVMTTLARLIDDPQEMDNPRHVKVVFDRRGNALYFSRHPIPFDRDGDRNFPLYKHLGVYAYTRAFLDIYRSLPESTLEHTEKLEQLRALEFGYSIRVVVTPYNSPEVDAPEDIGRIEALLAQAGNSPPACERTLSKRGKPS